MSKRFGQNQFDRSYPKGRLNADDDGAMQFAMAADTEHKRVILRFFKEVAWMGFDYDSGLAFLRGFAAKLSQIGPAIEIVVHIGRDGEEEK